jgi:hypothetical protein
MIKSLSPNAQEFVPNSYTNTNHLAMPQQQQQQNSYHHAQPPLPPPPPQMTFYYVNDLNHHNHHLGTISSAASPIVPAISPYPNNSNLIYSSFNNYAFTQSGEPQPSTSQPPSTNQANPSTTPQTYYINPELTTFPPPPQPQSAGAIYDGINTPVTYAYTYSYQNSPIIPIYPIPQPVLNYNTVQQQLKANKQNKYAKFKQSNISNNNNLNKNIPVVSVNVNHTQKTTNLTTNTQNNNNYNNKIKKDFKQPKISNNNNLNQNSTKNNQNNQRPRNAIVTSKQNDITNNKNLKLDDDKDWPTLSSEGGKNSETRNTTHDHDNDPNKRFSSLKNVNFIKNAIHQHYLNENSPNYQNNINRNNKAPTSSLSFKEAVLTKQTPVIAQPKQRAAIPSPSIKNSNKEDLLSSKEFIVDQLNQQKPDDTAKANLASVVVGSVDDVQKTKRRSNRRRRGRKKSNKSDKTDDDDDEIDENGQANNKRAFELEKENFPDLASSVMVTNVPSDNYFSGMF